MDKYYSCDRLLTLKDKNGKPPEIFITDGNRTAGKSVSYKKKLISTFLKTKDVNQFFYLYRNKSDMSNCADVFFNDIKRIFYPSYSMTEKRILNGNIVVLYLNGVECGYCLPLSMSHKFKNMSALFSRVKHGFFDEYQNENNIYLPNEVEKLMSLHISIARGDGEQHRYVPLYMASNTVSILNPYYSALGINKMLKKNTKILKGDGWVFERTYNENANAAMTESGFVRAFSKSKYSSFASSNVYLNDNESLIERPSGGNQYLLTVIYNQKPYNIRKYSDVVYVSTGCDETFNNRICFNVNDVVDDRALRVTTGNFIVIMLREYFNRGMMRFENLDCKNMTLDLLSYI